MPQATAKAKAPQSDVLDEELRHLVEELGLWFERIGIPRMAGRVLGWLLVCDPPEQTMQDLAEQLHASMGSVSTMTRLLDQLGLIERTSVPGERKVRYRIRPDAWTKTWDEHIEQARSFLSIADKGLALLEGLDAERRERLEGMREYTNFYVEQLPILIAKWEEHSRASRGRRRP